MVAVYCVLPSRGAVGVNVAVLLLTLTVPVTAPPAVLTSVKLAVVSVEFVIASENVADIEEFVATLIALFVGDVEDTVGADGDGGGGAEPPPPPLHAASTNASTGTSSKAFARKTGILIPSFLNTTST